MDPHHPQWARDVEDRIMRFAADFGAVYRRSERELSASFEIGCFHALVDFYRTKGNVNPANLSDGEYRYLTSPSGNPENFSYVIADIEGERFSIRQQVRIRSHIHPDIAFTPDLVVLGPQAVLHGELDIDFARGQRRFFFVEADDVVAAHECKSMAPFPELMVSFLGMLFAAHSWLEAPTEVDPDGPHLCPSLFVGGTARALHLRMVRALEDSYPMNVILGLHYGTLNLMARDYVRTLRWVSRSKPIPGPEQGVPEVALPF